MQVTQFLHRNAAIRGRKVATIFEGRKTTWAEHADRIARIAGGIRQSGIDIGDRVGILALNSDLYFQTNYAIIWSGAVTVPLNTRWSVDELTQAIVDAGMKWLFVDDAFGGHVDKILQIVPDLRIAWIGDGKAPSECTKLDDLVRSDPMPDHAAKFDDMIAIYYTGGTTGRSKGVMMPSRGLLASAMAIMAAGKVDDESRMLQVLAMFHVADLAQGLSGFIAGAEHTFHRRFDPAATLAEIERSKITHLPMVPTVLKMLSEHPEWQTRDLGSLRFIAVGGSAITESVFTKVLTRVPNCEVSPMFGQTEMSPLGTILHAKDFRLGTETAERLKSAGRATVVTEVKTVRADGSICDVGEIGEILVSGPVTMLGYWERPEETAATLVDGWIYSGDMGYLDKDGFLYIADRKKDMIVTGGENVFSSEVENVLANYQAISDCAVYGVPDEEWGETIVAEVILQPESAVAPEDIINFCRDHIAHYKCPRIVVFRGHPFPLTGAGKVLKRELRAQYMKKHGLT